MARAIGWALASCFLLVGIGLAGDEKLVTPDKTVEFGSEKGFVEKGQKATREVSVVVGQTLRWVNTSDAPMRAVSDMKLDGRPLFDTGILKPGEHKDIQFDIGVYRKADGKTASSVTLGYHSERNPDKKGTLVLISPAKRGRFGR